MSCSLSTLQKAVSKVTDLKFFLFFVSEISNETSILQLFYSLGFGSKAVTRGRQNNDSLCPTKKSMF